MSGSSRPRCLPSHRAASCFRESSSYPLRSASRRRASTAWRCVPRFFVILNGRRQDAGVLRLARQERFEQGPGRGEQLGIGLPRQQGESGRVGTSQPLRGLAEQPSQ